MFQMVEGGRLVLILFVREIGKRAGTKGKLERRVKEKWMLALRISRMYVGDFPKRMIENFSNVRSNVSRT